MSRERTLSSELIYSGRVVTLRVKKVLKPSGEEAVREIVDHNPCVAVVAVDEKDNILLVRQFRSAPEKELLEIPAGMIEPGEDPVAAVHRELAEEIGYIPGKLERLTGFYSSPGFCDEYLHLFLATDLTPDRRIAEDTDEIEVVRVPVSRVLDLIASEAIADGKSIAGLLLYLSRRKG